MDRLVRPVWAEIDLDAIAYNMKNIKKLAKDKEVIAVVKADCLWTWCCRCSSNIT